MQKRERKEGENKEHQGGKEGGGEGGLTPVGGMAKWGDAGHVLHVHVGSELGGAAREGGGRRREGRREGGGGKEDE